ncbi:MAG: 4-hydroxy-tetrahydrodipicolinate synthase [Actinomycetota bacterium]
MNKPRYGEVITAMVTPFAEDGTLDLAAARELADHLVGHGSDGLVVCGTTGESPTLSHEEKLALFEAIVEEVGGRASVIAGTGTYNTAESVELTKAAAGLGVDACLVVTPYYSRPPQNALIAHFSHIADESSVPLMIYDIPGRTGRRVERPTMLTLARHERIVAVKDAVGDPVETAKLRSELDAEGLSDFEIYSGDDVLLLPHLSAGAVGIVSVCSHLIGTELKQLFAAWNDGKIEEAQRIYLRYTPLMATIMGVTSSPIPVKYAVNKLGHAVGQTRLPLVPPTEDEASTIDAALQEAGLL